MRCQRCGRVIKPAKLAPGEHHDENACYADAARFEDQSVWILSCRDLEVEKLKATIIMSGWVIDDVKRWRFRRSTTYVIGFVAWGIGFIFGVAVFALGARS